MKAMILAAGLGTRLQPLTNKRPKALMPIVNRPIISRIIEYLKGYGITQIIVNAHHHSTQILDFLNSGKPFGVEIEVRVEPEILGTGGGIKSTQDFWDHDPFIVINSDILTDIDISQAYEYQKTFKNMATLILHDRIPFNQIRIDNNRHIVDISGQDKPGRLAFTGIHIINPILLSYIPKPGFSDIINCYRELIHSGMAIDGFLSEGHYWHDIGNISSYFQANKEILFMGKKPFAIGINTYLDPLSRLEEWAIIGDNGFIEEDVAIKRSIIWDNVRVKRGSTVIDSVVTSSREVDGLLMGEIY